MSFRFRFADPADLPACVDLLRAENGFRAEPSLWDALPRHWEALRRSPAVRFVVWEHLASPPGRRLHSFAASALVRPEFARALRERPTPWSTSALYAALGTRVSPLLTEREIAAANAGDGLDVLVLHNPLRHRDPDDPMLHAITPVGFAAFVFCHAGLQLRRVLWEVHGEHLAALLAKGGYRVRARFEDDARAAALPASLRPVLMELDRDALCAPSYDASGQWMFRRAAPVLGLTVAERRVIERALLGAPDREIARALGLSEHTVRRTWRSAIQRSEIALPALYEHAPRGRGGNGERGPSVRHSLLEYVRAHMEELRPYRQPARGARRHPE